MLARAGWVRAIASPQQEGDEHGRELVFQLSAMRGGGSIGPAAYTHPRTGIFPGAAHAAPGL